MCGVVGIVGAQPVNEALYNALTVMQHRGQDAAGIVTWSAEHGLEQRKSNGLVRDVFQRRHMMRLKGQCRYRACALSDGRRVAFIRGAAVLCKFSVRHLPGSQR